MAYQEWLVPVFTSSAPVSGVEVEASSIFDGSYSAWEAFNRTNTAAGDCWISKESSTYPQYLTVKFPVFVLVTSFQFQNRVGQVSGPSSYRLQGFNTNQNWITLWEDLNAPSGDAGAWRPEVTLPRSAYNWVTQIRLEILGSHEVRYVTMGQFKLSGYNDRLTDLISDELFTKWMWEINVDKVAPDADVLAGVIPASRNVMSDLSLADPGLFRFKENLMIGDSLFFKLDTKKQQIACWHNRFKHLGTKSFDFEGEDIVPAMGDIGASGTSIEGFEGMQIFTESGTFFVPEFVTKVDVLVVGGGGNGGGCLIHINGNRTGAGGSGGQVLYTPDLFLAGASTITVTVGMAGQGSAFGGFLSAKAGNNGGSTTGTPPPGASVNVGGEGAGGGANVNGINMSSIFGTDVGDDGWFGGGGTGGKGGGGVRPSGQGQGGPGMPNTGGGGAGSILVAGVSRSGGVGGSGIVIVKWSVNM